MDILIITLINIVFWICLHFGTAYLISSLPIGVKAHLFNYRNKFFVVGEGEVRFYKKIHINMWKDKLPQYNKDFDKSCLYVSNEQKYLAEFIENTCKAEVIHYSIGVLGFVSLLFSLFADDPTRYLPLYITIACAIFVCNLPFSLIQRYNRYRLVRLYEKLNDGNN